MKVDEKTCTLKKNGTSKRGHMSSNEAFEVAKLRIGHVQLRESENFEKIVHQNQKITIPLRRARKISPNKKKLHQKRSKIEKDMGLQS